MFELEEAHSCSRFLVLDRSSYQTCSSHILWIDRRAYIHCLGFGRRHRSAGRVDGGAFAVDDGERPGSVMVPDRNTFRCDDDGCSC